MKISSVLEALMQVCWEYGYEVKELTLPDTLRIDFNNEQLPKDMEDSFDAIDSNFGFIKILTGKDINLKLRKVKG